MVPTTFSLIEVNELKTPSAKHIKNNHQGNIFYSLPQKLKAKGPMSQISRQLAVFWGKSVSVPHY